MTKRHYRFGHDYLTRTCKMGIAMLKGERYYWLTDGYAKWLITDLDAAKGTVKVEVWVR